MAHQESLSSLPVPPEILISILGFLSVPDFIALTSVNKTLHSVYYEPTFWKQKTRLDFRLPPQPFFEQDGERWQWLYKSLKTSSTVYTWGKGGHGNLGRLWSRHEPQRSWPGTIRDIGRAGAVADVQCGGWSTVLLNTQGNLFAVGAINENILIRYHIDSELEDDASLIPVKMPPSDLERPNASDRAIKQFSMGRARLLALTDEDDIIEWCHDFGSTGAVLTSDIQQYGQGSAHGPTATQVVAGWVHGSAYFPTEGLYYWRKVGQQPEGTQTNRILTFQGDVRRVPGTKPVAHPIKDSIEDRLGTLKKYLILEHHMIMLTNDGKLFSWEIPPDDASSEAEIENWQPTDLTPLCLEHTRSDLVDIQGSFRKFAIFHKDGSVQICSLEEINIGNTPRFETTNNEPILINFEMPPTLQGGSVIQLAFGDYHYHALHKDGTITSYGKDPESYGALGFGPGQISFLRGVDGRPGDDGTLLVNPESDGRRTIWFEPEKFVYLSTMLEKLIDELRSDSLIKQMAGRTVTAFRETYAEFFEQEGRNWSSGPERPVMDSQADKHPMQPYFALKVTAAGWSGAAVVLVDKARAEEVRQKYLLPARPSEGKAGWTEWINELWGRAHHITMGRFDVDLEPTRRRCNDVREYVWSQQKFPLLRVPGHHIEEEEKLTSWKVGEPAWLSRSAS